MKGKFSYIDTNTETSDALLSKVRRIALSSGLLLYRMKAHYPPLVVD